MHRDIPLSEYIEKAEHYKAIGQTEVWLSYLADDDDKPWEFVSGVKAGGSYRLSGPASVQFEAAHPCGLTFRWHEDFERREANGASYSMFDRDRLRGIARRLPDDARRQFATFLEAEVLPGLNKVALEIRANLNTHEDSEDCVRGLVAFALGGNDQ